MLIVMGQDVVTAVKGMFDTGEFDFRIPRRAFSPLARYFNGTSAGKMRGHLGSMRSVPLEGFAKWGIMPTFGHLPVGNYDFNTGNNQETMHFLAGDLSWWVREEGEVVVPGQYKTLVVQAHNNLVLNVREPSLYVCDYIAQKS
jgi:uncharacterized protein YaiE (UPF0345 family)